MTRCDICNKIVKETMEYVKKELIYRVCSECKETLKTV